MAAESPRSVMRKYRQIGILMEAGADVQPSDCLSNPRKIDDLLSKGVVYKDMKKKYWVDDGKRDCFAIYARALNIPNGDNRVYWQWTRDSENENIEVARVVKTMWLEVRGSFWTMNLTPNTQYRVSFMTRVVPPVRSRHMPDQKVRPMKGQTVNLKLTLPDGTNQERQAQLPGQQLSPANPWNELEVGRFTMTAQNEGKLEFAMEQLFQKWRSGLEIKGVEIKAV